MKKFFLYILLFCSLSGNAQMFSVNGWYRTPSYSNSGGTGARTSIITATTTLTPVNPVSKLVDGSSTDANSGFFNNEPCSGTEIKFYFNGVPKHITEGRWIQDVGTAMGTWKWQGSDDNSSWTDIGSSFTLGGTTTQLQTQLNGNTQSYKYYRLFGVSGSISSTPWVRELEFKIEK